MGDPALDAFQLPFSNKIAGSGYGKPIYLYKKKLTPNICANLPICPLVNKCMQQDMEFLYRHYFVKEKEKRKGKQVSETRAESELVRLVGKPSRKRKAAKHGVKSLEKAISYKRTGSKISKTKASAKTTASSNSKSTALKKTKTSACYNAFYAENVALEIKKAIGRREYLMFNNLQVFEGRRILLCCLEVCVCIHPLFIFIIIFMYQINFSFLCRYCTNNTILFRTIRMRKCCIPATYGTPVALYIVMHRGSGRFKMPYQIVS